MHIRAANTIVYCTDFKKCVAFYSGLPGFTVAMKTEWLVEYRVADSAFVSVADASRTTIPSAGGKGLTLTFKVDDADAIHRLLSESGARITQPTDHAWGDHQSGARTFYVFDPEGRRLEFWSPLDSSS